MARRVSDTFKAGMITDVLGAEGSVQELSDMYVRRSGELCCRGPIQSLSATVASAGYHAGWSAATFHPNMGVAASRGVVTASATERYVSNADRWQLMGAGLQANVSATAISFSIVTEGANRSEVPLHAGVTGTIGSATGLPFERIISMTNAGDEVVMAGEIGSLYKWGGSLFGPYNTGTVAIASASASASRLVTGTGTTWGVNVQEGQYILMDGIAEKANTFQRAYRITKVVDNTHLEIELPIYATAGHTGIAYRIQSCAVIQSPDGVWNQTNERPTQVGVCCYHQGKIFTAGVADNNTAYNTVFNLDRIRWSGTLDENNSGYSHLDLWHNNAAIDVFPGIGGSIRGLVSMGNELVVVKSHGLFRVTGSSTYDGTGAGMAIQIISTEVGANGFHAWTLTSRGLVIAARDGLYLYDGEQVSSLTDGRVKRWWETNYPQKEFAVTQYEDKVIVSPVYWGVGSGNKLIWDAEQNLFWTMTSNEYDYLASVCTYTANDEYVGDYALSGGEIYTQNHGADKVSYSMVTDVTHKRGFDYTYGENDTYSSFPKPAVLTQPFPLGEDAVSEGRVNNVLVHAAIYNHQTPGFPSLIHTFVQSGSSYSGITNQWGNYEHFGTEYEMEYSIESDITEDLDRVFRIPVDSMDQAPSARILLDSHASGETPMAGLNMRIYAIGIDYEPSEVQGQGAP